MFLFSIISEKTMIPSTMAVSKGPSVFKNGTTRSKKKKSTSTGRFMFLSHQCIFTGWGWTHILGGLHVLYKLPRSSKLTMSSHTPWKRLLLVLLQGLLILADDRNSIGLRQIQDGDLSAGPSFVLSGESGGDLIASSWTPDESENRDLAISEAESIACAGFPAQNQYQQPAKSSKSRKLRRWR